MEFYEFFCAASEAVANSGNKDNFSGWWSQSVIGNWKSVWSHQINNLNKLLNSDVHFCTKLYKMSDTIIMQHLQGHELIIIVETNSGSWYEN